LKAIQHAHEVCAIAAQQRRTDVEDVESCHVNDRLLDFFELQLAGAEQQCQFLYLLIGGHQIAFDPVDQ
jgi:hypothetical protein